MLDYRTDPSLLDHWMMINCKIFIIYKLRSFSSFLLKNNPNESWHVFGSERNLEKILTGREKTGACTRERYSDLGIRPTRAARVFTSTIPHLNPTYPKH